MARKKRMKQMAKKISNNELSIKSIRVDSDKITAEISDGRSVAIPTLWFPKLSKASQKELSNYKISPAGYGIHWPDLDEDISIKSFVG